MTDAKEGSAATVAFGEAQRRLAGLTATELRLARALATEHTLRSYATQRGVSFETVRTQCKAVMRKLGVSPQVELVRWMLHHDPDRV